MYGQNRAIHKAFIIIKTVLSFTELMEALTKNIFVIAILKCTFIII